MLSYIELQFLIYLLNMHKWDSWERRGVRNGAEDWCIFVANKDLCQRLSGLRTPLGEFASPLLLVDILRSKSSGACVVDLETKVDETNSVYSMQINLNWRVVHWVPLSQKVYSQNAAFLNELSTSKYHRTGKE